MRKIKDRVLSLVVALIMVQAFVFNPVSVRADDVFDENLQSAEIIDELLNDSGLGEDYAVEPYAGLVADTFTPYTTGEIIPLHLRGNDFNGWGFNPSYQFTKVGHGIYAISFVKDSIPNEFKISGDGSGGWNGINIGAHDNQIKNIGASGNLSISLAATSKVNFYYNEFTETAKVYVDDGVNVNNLTSKNFSDDSYYTPNNDVYHLVGTHQDSAWATSDTSYAMSTTSADPYGTVQRYDFGTVEAGTNYEMKAFNNGDWIGTGSNGGSNLNINIVERSRVIVELDKANKHLSAIVTPITDKLTYISSTPRLTAVPLNTTQIKLNFSEPMTQKASNLKNQFTITKDGTQITISSAELSADKLSVVLTFSSSPFTIPEAEYTLTLAAGSLKGEDTSTENEELTLNLTTAKQLSADSFYSANLPGRKLWTVRGEIDSNWGYNTRNNLAMLDDNLYAISYVLDAKSYNFKLAVGDSWGVQFGGGVNELNYADMKLTLNERSKVTFYFKDNDTASSRKLYVYVEGESGKINGNAASITNDSKIAWYTPEAEKANIVISSGTLKTFLQTANPTDTCKFFDYNLDGNEYRLTRYIATTGTYTATAGDYGSVTVNVTKPAIATFYIDFNEDTPTLKYKFNVVAPVLSITTSNEFVKAGSSLQFDSNFKDEFGITAKPQVAWSIKTPTTGVSIAPTTGVLTVAPTAAVDAKFTVVATYSYNGSIDPRYNSTYTAEKELTVAGILTEFKFNYLRYDNSTDWNLWVWKDGEDGTDGHDLVPSSDGWHKGVVSFKEELSHINFLVRQGDWAAKDGGNRRFDLSKGNEVWLVQDDETVYYSKAEATAPRIAFAVMDTLSQVRFKVNGNPDNINFSNFVVLQDGKQLAGTGVKGSAFGEGVINISSPVNPSALLEVKDLSGTYAKKQITLRYALDNFVYNGNDLGYTKAGSASTFKVWAPTAKKVSVALYPTAGTYNTIGEVTSHNTPSQLLTMTYDTSTGVWTATSTQQLTGMFYMYKVEFANGTTNYAVDPYARAVSANGQRTAIVDLAATNPTGWMPNEKPATVTNETDHILYELHIRDFSNDPTASFENKGKYLAFTEEGLTYDGAKIGIDHLVELGVTTVHLLPSYDFKTVNELTVDNPSSNDPKMNWGYDPQNYNVPEGSYSTDPTNPSKRITEFKQMVQALHDANIRVVMDVVYNHTFDIETGPFNKIVPGYYYRTLDSNMAFADGSGCGNEVASERPMVRKYIIDSVKYWAKEYNVDGFRFDLFGLIDETTASMVASQLKSEIDPTMIIYGEPWQAGGSPLQNGVGKGSQKDQGYAVFNDNIRGAIKGDSDSTGKGFATGEAGKEGDIVVGVYGTTDSQKGFANSPTEVINYVTAHDNLNLYDKVVVASGLNDTLKMLWHKMLDGAMKDGSSVDEAVANATPYAQIDLGNVLENNVVRRTVLSTAMIMTMQGIPFYQAGDEFLRTKYGDHNSYKSPDSINTIRWENKANFTEVSDYYAGLSQLRKEHPAFRMSSTSEMGKLEVLKSDNNVVAFKLGEYANGDTWKNIVVIYNGNETSIEYTLPQNTDPWKIVVHDKQAGTTQLGADILGGGTITVGRLSAMVLYDTERASTAGTPTTIELERDSFVVEPNKTTKIKVTVKDQYGAIILNPTIEAVSADETVATYSNGVISGLKKGSTTITLTCGAATKTFNVAVVGLSVSVEPTSANSRQNAVIKVESSDIDIKSMQANLSSVGGSSAVNVSKESGILTFGVRDYITAGAKKIPVTVTDANNNVYVVDVDFTVTQTPTTGFDWDEARIYFMLTDRFYDGDEVNNNELVDKADPGAYHGGDFAGVTAKLDYLKGLGINTIWITPIVENVTGDFGTQAKGSYYAYHGYWANDFEKLNPYLGTRAELETLIDEAAARGMKIMADVVLNHGGYDTESNANFAGMYRTESIDNDDEKMSLAGLPDFKTEDQEVRSKLIGWQTAWANLKTEKGNSIAYFRLDTAKHVDHETLKQFKAALAEANAEHKIIGEIWSDDAKINTYLNNGEMDSAIDFSFNEIAKDFVNGNLDKAEQALEARNGTLSNVATKGQFLSSHDEEGFLYSLGGDEDKMKAAVTLQITAKGQPIIYYGEEIGMTGESNWPLYDNRKDFDWSTDFSTNELYQHYSKLLNIRASYSKLFSKGSRGKVAGSDSESYMMFNRIYQNQMALVAVNMNETEATKQITLNVPQGSVLQDVYNKKSYTVGTGGNVSIDIPALADGGTAVLIYTQSEPIKDNNQNSGVQRPKPETQEDTTTATPKPAPAEKPSIGAPVTAGSTTNVGIVVKPEIKDNTATAKIPDSAVSEALKSVKHEANNKGTQPSVEIKITGVGSATNVNAVLTKASLELIVKNDVTLTITSPFATISLNNKAVQNIVNSASNEVNISTKFINSKVLDKAAKEKLGDRSIFDFTVTSGGKEIKDFGNGNAKISVPYKPTAAERANKIVIYYVNPSEKLEVVRNCKYDEKTGRVYFITTHFSRYAIGYNNTQFDDIPVWSWYLDAVDFVSARDLFAGTGGNSFSPSSSMTRGMFATVLAKVAGVDTSQYTSSKFYDVDIDKWYGKSIAWVSEIGVMSGYDNGNFGPNDEVTREQMAVILSNYIKYKNIVIPKDNSDVSFSDKDTVSSWAISSVEDMKRYGIMSGVGENKFAPKSSANRVEVASVFMKFVKAFVK